MSYRHITFSDQQQKVVDYFKRNFVRHPHIFNTHIHRNCQMFSYGFKDAENSTNAVFSYFYGGLQMLYPLRQIIRWKFKSFAGVSNFLDFASGFGRLTRFLVQEMDANKIWISEIQEEAVEFQKAEFGVNGIFSVTDPNQFRCEKRFDCIFVASLFTHLPEKRFHEWLSVLNRLLTPDGILIFTVHDYSNAPQLNYSESGFHYNPNVSEIKTLDSLEYGSTHVTENFVSNAIYRATDGSGKYYRFPKGLWHHDLYVISKSDDYDRPDIGIIVGPLSPLTLSNVGISGWAFETREGHDVSEIQILCKGEVVYTCIPEETCSDAATLYGNNKYLLSGWSCSALSKLLNQQGLTYDDDLAIRAISTAGDERLVPVLIHEGDQKLTSQSKKTNDRLKDSKYDAVNTIKVSVVIPCYNHGEFLNDAVQSVIESKCDDYEIIIVNDGSTDGHTINVFKEFEQRFKDDERVKIIHQENSGLAHARNNAIKSALGEYILPLDADNKIRPSYLKKAVDVLDSRSDVGIVYSYAQYFGDKEGIWEVPVFNSRKLLLGNFIDACAVFRKVIWEQCNGFDPDMGIMGYEDWDFWIGAMERGWKFHLIKEVLFDYRVRNDSMIAACNIPENRCYLIKYICNKHRDTYIENMAYVISEKDVMTLNLTNYAKNIEAHAKNLEVALKDKDNHINNLEAHINAIMATRGWRLLEKFRRIRRKLLGK